jgi:uncharacterized protein (DUF2336 family)
VIRGGFRRLIGGKTASEPSLSFEEATKLARSGDPEDRCAVAADPNTKPELLYFLARDSSPKVRSAIASHLATPRQADLLLALDESPDIRLLVAEKVTKQVRSLGQDEAAQLWQLTVSVLEALAKDDLVSVRQLVAETAKGLEKIPKPIAYSLAKDREPDVAVPALAYPGRFVDEELVSVVEAAHDSRIVTAVARRPMIGIKVSEAVVVRGDEAAITALLSNKSAQIDSQTLDRVIEQAASHPAWHEALVNLPSLPASAVAKLSGIVGATLGGVLRGRRDVDRTSEVGQRPSFPATPPTETIVPEVVIPNEDPLARARRLQTDGRLDEDTIVDTLGTDLDFTIAALSIRSRLPPAVVAKILSSHSAKGLTSLAWKSGYSMRLALQLQIRIGRLPPKARLTSSGGTWPLSQSEMDWQIDFFKSLAVSD